MLPPRIVAHRIMYYGVFLLVCGALGFVATGNRSASALVNGIIGGILMLVLGALHKQRRTFALPAAIAVAGIFTASFVWRTVVHLRDVASSADAPSVAVIVLVLVMALASGYMSVFLFKNLKV